MRWFARRKSPSKRARLVARDDLAEFAAEQLRDVADRLAAGNIAPQQWLDETWGIIRRAHGAEYVLGRGGVGAMTSADLDTLSRLLSNQLGYLRAFFADLAAGSLTDAEVASRAALYGEAAIEAFERGQAARYDGLSLPAYPADGSTECIASAQSRVLTRRGWVPIRDVVVGDRVWTHRGRWRRVTATPRTIAGPGRPVATISVANMASVTFTTDHRLHTRRGWLPASDILMDRMPVHCERRGEHATRHLPIVRTNQRLPSRAVPVVRQSAAGNRSVVGRRPSRNDLGPNQGERKGSSFHLRRYQRAIQLAKTRRWPTLLRVLGRRHKKIHLSLSMAMDQAARPDSRGVRDSSPRWRSVQRRHRQPRLFAGQRPPIAARGALVPNRRARAGDDPARRGHRDVRTMRIDLSGQKQKQGKSLLLSALPHRRTTDDPHLPRLRRHIRGRSRSWQTPKILHARLLNGGETLYDLTVEGDHSFVVEGIVAHNCLVKCRCAWVIEEFGDRWEATWDTRGDDRVCPTCADRGQRWAPLVVEKAG